MREVQFHGDQGEFLSITLQRRTHPDACDYWDGNWVSASVNVTVGGFRASVAGNLRAEDFQQFRDQLVPLQQPCRGSATFETLEGCLAITVTTDGKRHMQLTCTLRDEPGVGNTLTFSLVSDQTFTRGALDELHAAVDAFPVIGRP